jgi:hypothetical protein
LSQAIEQLVDALGPPPFLHVRFAETECASAQYAAEEALVLHLDVAWPRAVDPNIYRAENFLHRLAATPIAGVFSWQGNVAQ